MRVDLPHPAICSHSALRSIAVIGRCSSNTSGQSNIWSKSVRTVATSALANPEGWRLPSKLTKRLIQSQRARVAVAG